jgi:SAM-dependent methyltransferase
MPTPARPEDVEVEETYRFLAPHLAGASRLLDVGCGNGLLARRLAQAGFAVTAVDVSLKRTERSPGIRFVETDFLTLEDAPFDALVFSASLHHLSPLEAALATAHRLLRPGGRLLAADFDVDSPDEETARWYYTLEGLLLAAGLYRADKVGGSEADPPLLRWHKEHEDTPPLHPGRAMQEALARRFGDVGTSRGPYLYRYLVGGLAPTPQATAIAEWARATEERQLASGALRPVGLRLWARRVEG